MTKLYLIRHAEAEGNLYRRAQGHFNANVTQLGRRQIAALAERFRDIPIAALWSSDLYRTQSTAAAILRYHPKLTLRLSPELREIDVGVWEDVPWGNIQRDYPEELAYFTNDPAQWSVPGGEPYLHVAERMKRSVLRLAEENEGKTVAVVSHGLAIRALLCDHFGIPSAEIARLPYGDNTSVTLLSVEDGRITVEWYNDASHLAGGLSTFERQSWWRKTAPAAGEKKLYAEFDPLELPRERELYSDCYARTWMQSHGNLKGYVPLLYLRTAQSHAARDPRCVMKLRLGDAFAGIIELDPERGRENDAGWVSLLYVDPAMRSRRLGVQLIGHAVSYFRRAGRSALRLHVSETNTEAVGFYEHIGFRRIGTADGVGGMLFLMEMDIRPRALTPEELF